MKLHAGVQKDFVASSLRSQIVFLNTLLEKLETAGNLDVSVIDEQLKQTEAGLRKLRRACSIL